MFTIHGLWPEYNNGSWPQYCADETFRPSTIDKIGKAELRLYWPNAENVPMEPIIQGKYSIWDHEWSKHGTCTGLSQLDYFNETLFTYQELMDPFNINMNLTRIKGYKEKRFPAQTLTNSSGRIEIMRWQR
jgi:ribonuclease I